MDSPDPRTPALALALALAAVQDAYATWTVEYIDLFGSADNASMEDPAVIAAWSETVVGPVLDAGCRPGHWSSFLHSRGLEVEGVDATASFVQSAAETCSGISFRWETSARST